MKEEIAVNMAILNFTEFFENAEGERLEGTTATNASCAYGFLNYPEQATTL